jgi:hypothetical protein
MIGLSGAQGVGKSTLAREASVVIELPFVQTTTSSVFRESGLDPAIRLSFEDRILIQNRILNTLDEQWGAVTDGRFITDRTPLDMIGYTLAEIGQEPMTTDQEVKLRRYIQKCAEVCNKRFSAIIVVHPPMQLFPRPENQEGKAVNTWGFVEHVNRIILGSVSHPSIKVNHFFIPSHMTDLKARVSAVQHAHRLMQERMMQGLMAAEENGMEVVFH